MTEFTAWGAKLCNLFGNYSEGAYWRTGTYCDLLGTGHSFQLRLRLPYTFRGVSRLSDVARPVLTADAYTPISN